MRQSSWQAAVVVAAIALSPIAATAETIKGRASVIDGDTIEIHGVRIRLHGIDAPEGRQRCTRNNGSAWRCGKDAAFALADHISGQVVSCQALDRDRYGRVVARCDLGREDVNRWMVRQGWAVAYRRYSRDYLADETAAREARRGIWSGKFELPWIWRRNNR